MPILLRLGFSYSVTIGTLEAIASSEPGDVLVLAKGVTTTAVRERTGFGGLGDAIACSGIGVAAGDWVVADGSGTIFIPYRDAEPVLAGAKDAGGYERALRQRFAEGDDPVEARESMRYDELGKAA